MPHPDCIITAFDPGDLGRIGHLQPEGWDDIVPFFEFYCAAPFCNPVAGIADGRIAGVGCSIVNGPTGWIAHIIVDETYRSRGLGRLLTQRCLDDLAARGCETQLLIATALGEPLYKKLGFTTVSLYRFYRGPRLDIDTSDPHITPLLGPDVEAMFALDRELTGEDRAHVLEWHGTTGWGYFDGRTNDLRGFYLPRIGEGLIVARDGEAGVALLDLKHSRSACKTVLPAENEAGNGLLAAHGFERFLEAPRMIRGKPIEWIPGALFSRIGGWYG